MIKTGMGLIMGILLLMSSLVLAYLNFNVSQERQMFIANQLYSTWSVELMMELGVDELILQLPTNSRVFFEHSSNGNLRTFHQNGDWQPPMISGQFFDLNSSRKEAVVGAYHTQNGEMTVEIAGVFYEIIGVLGAGYPSVLDRLILVNITPEDMPIGNIVIDTRNSADMAMVQNLFDVNRRHQTDTALDFLDSYALNTTIRQNVIIVSIILSLLLGYAYLLITEKRNHALHLVGVNKIRIFVNQLLELLALAVGSFIIIFVIDYTFGHGISLSYWYNYVFLLFLILLSYPVNALVKLFLKFGGELLD